MKLSTIISDYRSALQISQREFARRCDLSNSYISFLEKDINPKTGKPMVPTLYQYKKLASGMDMTVQQLFELLDEDAPVDLADAPFSFRSPDTMFNNLPEEEKVFLDAYRAADDRARADALATLLQHPAAKK